MEKDKVEPSPHTFNSNIPLPFLRKKTIKLSDNTSTMEGFVLLRNPINPARKLYRMLEE
jgi:hypothetical protein